MMEDCQLKIMQNFAEQSLGNPHGSTDIQNDVKFIIIIGGWGVL